jgi:hypothetical protein
MSSEIVSCSNCQKKLQVPEDLLGQEVQCPSCGTSFTAGTAPPPLPLPPHAVQPERKEPKTEPEAEADVYRRSAGGRRRYVEEDDHGREEGDEREGRRARRRDQEPHRGSLILTLGILSLAGGFLCGGIPLFLGPVAWILGSADMAEIRAGRMDAEGEGATNAGRICGIVATVLLVLAVIAAAVLISALALATAGR